MRLWPVVAGGLLLALLAQPAPQPPRQRPGLLDPGFGLTAQFSPAPHGRLPTTTQRNREPQDCTEDPAAFGFVVRGAVAPAVLIDVISYD
ncbi:hypothetical protein Y1Q_0002218 [Alligator mississippiensis]|uniref:Uncharacterized protein n=1 Tax=Alligator mississippiensis TaxID=8496 RepID=A0A151MLL3_ALLMI|nr:hypothetical protein Y1Q_0002218 [Alligator mississippiensis]